MTAATLSSNDLLLGIGLVLALAVGSQLAAQLLRLPAIVPVGFVAGILTEDVQPDCSARSTNRSSPSPSA